jgi:threonine dehydrogenase-like Zn-dependent dehydrogenase
VLVKVTGTNICGSDLHIYMQAAEILTLLLSNPVEPKEKSGCPPWPSARVPVVRGSRCVAERSTSCGGPVGAPGSGEEVSEPRLSE